MIISHLQKIQEIFSIFQSLDFVVTSEHKLKFLFQMKYQWNQKDIYELCDLFLKEIMKKENISDEELQSIVEFKMILNDLKLDEHQEKKSFKKI